MPTSATAAFHADAPEVQAGPGTVWIQTCLVWRRAALCELWCAAVQGLRADKRLAVHAPTHMGIFQKPLQGSSRVKGQVESRVKSGAMMEQHKQG